MCILVSIKLATCTHQIHVLCNRLFKITNICIIDGYCRHILTVQDFVTFHTNMVDLTDVNIFE